MTAERAGYGVLTDESFERSRRRIGIPLRINPAHITQVTADASARRTAAAFTGLAWHGG